MNNIDCSINGFKELSPEVATVKLYGENLTIEEHILKTKKEILINNKSYNYITIDKKDLDFKFLEQYYSALWVKYFDNNPDLVDKIRKMENKEFYSSKASVLDNIHIDIISKFFKVGRYIVVRDYKELRDVLGNSNMWNHKDYLISKHKKDFNKSTFINKHKLSTLPKKSLNTINNKNLQDLTISREAILYKNTIKPTSTDETIRLFKHNQEKFKIVKKDSKIMAFKIKRSNSNYSEISIFDINKLKNISLNNIENEYLKILKDKQQDISRKSIKTIALEVYNYINKK